WSGRLTRAPGPKRSSTRSPSLRARKANAPFASPPHSRNSSPLSMPQAPTPALSARLDFVRRRLIELELEAIVVTALPNILYLTNFSGSSAIVVVTGERVLFLTDSRYVSAVGAAQGTTYACPRMEIIEVEGSYDARLAEVLAGPSADQAPA